MGDFVCENGELISFRALLLVVGILARNFALCYSRAPFRDCDFGVSGNQFPFAFRRACNRLYARLVGCLGDVENSVQKLGDDVFLDRIYGGVRLLVFQDKHLFAIRFDAWGRAWEKYQKFPLSFLYVRACVHRRKTCVRYVFLNVRGRFRRDLFAHFPHLFALDYRE